MLSVDLKKLSKLLVTGILFSLFTWPMAVMGQIPIDTGPYTVDTNTVALLHFDGSDSIDVQSASHIATPDTAQVWSERQGAVRFPEASPMSGFGGSVFLRQTDSDVSNNIYNFLRVVNKNDVFDLANDITIQGWFRVADSSQSNRRMKLFFKPGDPFYYNNFAIDIFDEPGNMYAKSGFHTVNDDWVQPYGAIPTENTSIGDERGRWLHYTFIRDHSDSTLTTAVYNVNGVLFTSYQRNWTGEPDKALADTANSGLASDLYFGINPKFNVTGGETGINEPPSTWGDAADQQFFGYIDEVRVSNTARNVTLPLMSPGATDMFTDKKLVPVSQDSVTFAFNVDWYNGSYSNTTVMLHYDAGSGIKTKEMSRENGSRYSTRIANFSEGTTVDYYATVFLNGKQYGRYPYGGGTESYKVEFKSSRVLKLSFEENGKAPYDSARFHYDMDFEGDTTYSSDAKDGSFSYKLGGATDVVARSAGATGTDAVTVDLWFKPKEIPSDSSRLVAKELENDSSKVNYSIFFKDSTLYARSTGAGDIALDTTVSPNNWYRVVYMMDSNAQSLQLMNSQGTVMDWSVERLKGSPIVSEGPLYIGQGDFLSDRDFQGLVDRLVIHNYPAKAGPQKIGNVTKLISESASEKGYPINARLIHAGKGPLNVTLHYNSGSGWVKQIMKEDGIIDRYKGEITQKSGRTLVDYFVKAENEFNSMTMPVGAQENQTSPKFSFALFEPFTKVLDMDFEAFEQDTSVSIPVDQSSYSEFHEVRVRGDDTTAQFPTVASEAIQGDHSMRFRRKDTSSIEIHSKFLAMEEITISMWFKFTEFDPEHVGNGSFPYWQTIQLLTKHKPGDWQVTNHYNIGVLNKPYSGQPQTLIGRSMTENSGERAIHDGLDMDSSLKVGNWYRAVYEYNKNDTAFTQLYDSTGTLIEEVGMETNRFGPQLKGADPLTIGSHFLDANTFGGNLFSGYIDDVEIYNYAARSNAPKVTGITEIDSATSASERIFKRYVIGAGVRHNGEEPVFLKTREITSSGMSAWDSTKMAPDLNINNYTAKIPEHKAGTVVEYYVGTQNDFGTTAQSSKKRLPFFGKRNSMALDLTFESGKGDVIDRSQYGWTVNKVGVHGVPTFTDNAIRGNYAMKFAEEDSSYLEIDAPSPLLNQKSFTVDLWFKSYEEHNSNVRLLSKQGGSRMAWWKQNFQMSGIGGNSWTFGGYLPNMNLDFSDRLIGKYLDNSEHFGNQEVREALQDSTWYHVRYIQDLKKDSILVAFTDRSGSVVAKTSMEIPGDTVMSTVITGGPFRIGHAGRKKHPYFEGVVDNVKIRNFAAEDVVETRSTQVDLVSGWNLIGLPSDTDERNAFSLLPSGISGTLFEYTDTYVQDTTLETGKGYWLRSVKDTSRILGGTVMDSVGVHLQKGWNLIAGPSKSLAINDIPDFNTYYIPRTLYGYDNGYFAVDTIRPAHGYWLKSVKDTSVVFKEMSSRLKISPESQPVLDRKASSGDGGLATFHRVTLKSGKHKSPSIYFGGDLSGSMYKQSSFSLPPKAPGETFDARLADGSQLTETAKAAIKVDHVQDQLTIQARTAKTAKEATYHVKVYKKGKQIAEQTMRGKGQWTINKSSVGKVTVSLQSESLKESQLPDKITLRQNYPNPFNPSTTIKYGLPQKRDVRLEVYTVSGRRVATLVNRRQSKGWHTVKFDASQLASGVYFYRLEIDETITRIRKMILLK